MLLTGCDDEEQPFEARSYFESADRYARIVMTPEEKAGDAAEPGRRKYARKKLSGEDVAQNLDIDAALGGLNDGPGADSRDLGGYGGLGIRGTGGGSGKGPGDLVGLGRLGTSGATGEAGGRGQLPDLKDRGAAGNGYGDGDGYGYDDDDDDGNDKGQGERTVRLAKKKARKVSIVTSAPVVMGSLSKEEIRRVIRSNLPQVRSCYERAAESGEMLSFGKINIEFTISPTGYVAAARAATSTADNPELERCLAMAMKRMRFPQPKGGGIIVVRYPFNFRALGAKQGYKPDAAEAGALYRKKTVFEFEEEIVGGLAAPQGRYGEPPADPYAGVSFISTQGYFENTYLPGDPRLQWLRQQLEHTLEINGRPFEAERSSIPYIQPFDPPQGEGLAAYLSADREAIEGPTRLTLQVGLKGSLRHARRRAALNAALVVDLTELPNEAERRILWSLAEAVAADLQAGDRFTLVVAGVAEPLRLTPQHFDAAAVRRELARAYEEREATESPAELMTAVAEAFHEVADQGDEDAPLGAKLVLLISAGRFAAPIAALETRIHGWAAEGISLTGIGVGTDIDADALARLARAGQGRRRLVTDIRAARRVMEQELAASGRVVARAVRLRLRLAEGVKLVRILDSRPLQEHEAEVVRQAEAAIDLKVSQSLGIEADRGEDEDGLQTVIPAYYAGDDHVILLDVVVPGPGPIADLQVRYKDLVNLRNAVARSSLALANGPRSDGPLCLAVRKNRLAHDVAAALLEASKYLDRQQPALARAVLDRAVTAITRLRVEVAGLSDDPELARDAWMLARYEQAMSARETWPDENTTREHLVHSLAFAGRVKLPPGAPR